MTTREWDVGLEKEVADWIEAVTCIIREPDERASIHTWLKSGEILCKLANEIKPGSIPKFNEDTSSLKNLSLAAFRRRENISYFLRFCREICCVPEKDLFGTDDLFDAKDIKQVLSSLFSLAGVIQVTIPEFTGPKLGLPPRGLSVSPLKKKGFPQPDKVATNFGTLVMKGSDAFNGAVTTTSSDPPSPPPSWRAPVIAESPEISSKFPGSTPLRPLDLSHGELERVVVEWVGLVLGEAKPEDISAARWLKSGEVICALANKIKPGSVTGIVPSHENPMKVRENISKFIRVCRELGVRENDLFTSVDLYEGKNIHACINCIYNLGGVIQAVLPGWEGPALGKKQQPTRLTK